MGTDELIKGLTEITVNLAHYVEEQAQLIAKPKIEAAEGRYQARAAQAIADVVLRAERAEALAAELRRRITALERHEARLVEKVRRVEDLAADMDTWCSPYGMATQYADRVRGALNGAKKLAPPTALTREL